MHRRMLLISGAAAALTPLLSCRAQPSVTQLKPLGPGSRIRAVNPGTWMDPERDLELLRARCAAAGWNLEITFRVLDQWRYFSATDRNRAADMASAWGDPGVGSGDGEEAQWRRTVQLLRDQAVAPLQGESKRAGTARGPLLVANLTVATHLIGTPWLPSMKGAVLVLQDVGEAPYRVDRMLTHWRSAGLLQQLAGVACGRFSWAEDDILPGDFSMEEVLEERLGDLGIPLVVNLPLGHGQPNQTLPLGSIAELDGHRGRLHLLR